jgi:integrase
MTVAQLLTHWHDDVLRHQVVPSNVVSYWTVAGHHMISTLGSKRLANLTTADVDRLLSVKLDSGLSVSTVRRIRYIPAQAIDQGIWWGSVNINWARLSRAPKEHRREVRTLTYEQARRLLKELEGHRHEALYSLMLSTGLRRGEALGLKWRDFDEESRMITVRRQLKREGGSLITEDTKTARSRRSVNIPRGLVNLLVEHRHRQEDDRYVADELWTDTSFIFTTNSGTPIDPRNLNPEFATICQHAGLEHRHPHELRHSAASLMLASGVKLQVVSEVLGHASIRMTADVYGHILAPDREAAADAMDKALWRGD